ncbi:DUF2304 domain-containing protein [Longispora albida]|uniref:DUF2304 domain-containing protein n=1 Tax=Longispora albida TaxID=203523 RepID=UPI00038257F6|nr:DUF2304 domain-containing protein [Longispora albida]
MRLHLVTGLAGLIVLVVIFELLRRRQLRVKYGALWLVVAAAALPLAVVPSALDGLAGVLGIASGVSLVLFGAVVFLLLVCIHLSWEVSRLEEETRALAEDVALIRADLDRRGPERPHGTRGPS